LLLEGNPKLPGAIREAIDDVVLRVSGLEKLPPDSFECIVINTNNGAYMILPTDIHTLDSFRRKSKEHVDRLHSTGRPEVLTVNGRASVVVQDAAAYQHQAEKLAVLAALAQSVREADSGQVHDARKAVQKLLNELKPR
jgi:PHD/YefM family antitoxin component YafN of YafNO toxin-antitoxin module